MYDIRLMLNIVNDAPNKTIGNKHIIWFLDKFANGTKRSDAPFIQRKIVSDEYFIEKSEGIFELISDPKIEPIASAAMAFA